MSAHRIPWNRAGGQIHAALALQRGTLRQGASRDGHARNQVVGLAAERVAVCHAAVWRDARSVKRQGTLDHAFRLLQVAAGAAADGFLVSFTAEELPQVRPEARMGILQAFRTYRDTKLELLSPHDLPLTDESDDK